MLLSMQVSEARVVAGSASTLAYARLDIVKFRSIYSAKGPWSLLTWLNHTSFSYIPANRALCDNLSMANSQQIIGGKDTKSLSIPYEEIELVVKEAITRSLGADAIEGGWVGACVRACVCVCLIMVGTPDTHLHCMH